MMYIVSQLMNGLEKEELNEIFRNLDKNGDGKLSYDELMEGYTKLYKNKDRAIAEVNYLLSTADVDNNGVIEYSGILLS